MSDKNKDVNFVAVSHSDVESTEKWVIAVGGKWDVNIVVDSERDCIHNGPWVSRASTTFSILSPCIQHGSWASKKTFGTSLRRAEAAGNCLGALPLTRMA